MDRLLDRDYHPSYDEGDPGLITSESREDSYAVRSLAKFEQFGWRWWLLHPYFQVYIRESSDTARLQTSNDGLNSIGGFCLNRGTQSALVLLNGLTTFPQQNIPLCDRNLRDPRLRQAGKPERTSRRKLMKRLPSQAKHAPQIPAYYKARLSMKHFQPLTQVSLRGLLHTDDAPEGNVVEDVAHREKAALGHTGRDNCRPDH
ncbi:hypothetical protein DL546_007533 [Coniochaeta pulveracea]|uniref:Uncharacterized protein n=1 Tax=Coniochaeta pulveracea TaxID=177199 RepID=A0A420YK92_9PEZI|nr:hypothetical protein DL546_007533 [Coniochaeta pulveracea]